MNGTKNARTGIYMMLALMLVSITKRLPGTKNLSERLSTGMTTLVLAAVVLLVAAGHGLDIGADDIVIDGDGYTIDGVNAGNCATTMRDGVHGLYFAGTRDNVTIKDLKVKNFCSGIYL